MAQLRTGRGWLCETDEVTDTRHWEHRRGAEQVALTAAEFTAIAPARLTRQYNPIDRATADLPRPSGRGAGSASGAALLPVFEALTGRDGAGVGGQSAVTEAWGGSPWSGEEVW